MFVQAVPVVLMRKILFASKKKSIPVKKTFFSYRVITGRRNKSYYCASHEPNNQTITHKENNLRAGNWIELTLFLITGGKNPLFSLFLFPVRQKKHTSRIELWWHHRHTDHLSVITNGAHSWYSNWSTATEIKTLHCLPFCWPRGFRCAHTARHCECFCSL